MRRNSACCLWLIIDHFWLILRCNLLALLLVLPIVTSPLAFAGSLRVCDQLITHRRACMADFAYGIRRLGVRMYLWTTSLVVLWTWCMLSIKFYAKQGPLLQSMGCTATLVLLIAANILGYLVLPGIAKGCPWKECLRMSLRWILEEPATLMRLFVAMAIAEGLLMLTGLGFLIAGLLWPVLGVLLAWKQYRHLRYAEPPYQEDRCLKDFLFPSNLLK